jgi:hypothetical protein
MTRRKPKTPAPRWSIRVGEQVVSGFSQDPGQGLGTWARRPDRDVLQGDPGGRGRRTI